MTQQPAAGWYPDPHRPQQVARYWDGRQWTSNVTPRVPSRKGQPRNVPMRIGVALMLASFVVAGLLSLMPATTSALGFTIPCGPAIVALLADGHEFVAECRGAAVAPLLWAFVIGALTFLSGLVVVIVSRPS